MNYTDEEKTRFLMEACMVFEFAPYRNHPTGTTAVHYWAEVEYIYGGRMTCEGSLDRVFNTVMAFLDLTAIPV